jgi:hypothetical protein
MKIRIRNQKKLREILVHLSHNKSHMKLTGVELDIIPSASIFPDVSLRSSSTTSGRTHSIYFRSPFCFFSTFQRLRARGSVVG